MPTNLDGLDAVTLLRRHKLDAAVGVPMVVPVDKSRHPPQAQRITIELLTLHNIENPEFVEPLLLYYSAQKTISMKSTEILLKAEMCWRQHVATMLLVAASVEIESSYRDAGSKALVDYMPIDEGYSSILRIIGCLIDPAMPFHPKVCGRLDVVEAAHSYISTFTSSRPLTCVELSIYFDQEKTTAKAIANQAIKAFPTLLRLYYLQKEFIIEPAKQLRFLLGLHSLNITYQDGPVSYTALTQMAIGHMGKYLDTKLYLAYLRGGAALDIKDWWVDTSYSSCKSLCRFLRESNETTSHEHRSIIIDLKEIVSIPIKLLSSMYLANPEPEWFAVDIRNALSSSASKAEEINSAVIHLRTANFKYNDGIRTMGIRSVSPSSYEDLHKYLSEERIRVTQISADKPPVTIPGCNLWHVEDEQSENHQWYLYSSADFVVATQSGISHLLELGPKNGYLTNYTCIPIDAHIRKTSLLHCKRISPTPKVNLLGIEERLSLLVYQWGHSDGALVDYVEIEDLSPAELIEGGKEYLRLLKGSSHPLTLYRLLQKTGLAKYTKCVPDQNLASTTYFDMLKILTY